MNIKHNLIKIVGGTYYDKETDSTYIYTGKIKCYINGKYYNNKAKFSLMYLDIKIQLLKRKN